MDKSQLDLRTKPSVREGLVFDYETPTVRFVDYQPGNGNRYWFSIMTTIDFSDEVNERLGFGGGTGYVVTDLNGRRSMMLIDRGFLAARYVREKLECSWSDGYVLAELFGYLLERDYEKAGS
jgi:hypothetical protein